MSASPLAAWDAMADSIANRRDECIERGQNVQADLYRDMIAGHRQARAAVAELVEAANRAERFIANVPTDKQLDARMQSGDTGRKAYGSLRAALAKFGGGA